MTQYDKNWPWLQSVIRPEKIGTYSRASIAGLNYKNLRTRRRKIRARDLIFMGRRKTVRSEERILVPSPKVAHIFEAGNVAEGITIRL